jgi:hypothetical protein
MNMLDMAKRTQIVTALVEGMGVPSNLSRFSLTNLPETSRVAG